MRQTGQCDGQRRRVAKPSCGSWDLRIMPSDCAIHEANAMLNTKSPNQVTGSTQFAFARCYHQREQVRHLELGTQPRTSIRNIGDHAGARGCRLGVEMRNSIKTSSSRFASLVHHGGRTFTWIRTYPRCVHRPNSSFIKSIKMGNRTIRNRKMWPARNLDPRSTLICVTR